MDVVVELAMLWEYECQVTMDAVQIWYVCRDKDGEQRLVVGDVGIVCRQWGS